MLSNRSYWMGRYLPLLAPDGENGGSGAESESKTGDTTTSTSTGEKGDDKEALRRMGEQRDAARDEARRLAEERDALLKDKREREDAEAKAREDEAAKKGEFEALAKKREEERDKAKSELEQVKARNTALEAAMAEGLAVRLKDLPDPLVNVLNDTVGEDDALARWQWLHKPSVQDLIKAHDTTTETVRGNGRDPKSTGAERRTVEDEARLINRTGNYAM